MTIDRLSQGTISDGASIPFYDPANGADRRASFSTIAAAVLASLPSDTSGDCVLVSGPVTINTTNAATYNGKTLEWTTAAAVTLSYGLPQDFGFSGIPPASGNASIVSDGVVLLNGATTTLVRTFASNQLFAVVQRKSAADLYLVTGV